MEVRHGGAFGGSPLDRMNQKRGDPAFLRECLEAPAIRVMAVDASKRILVRLAPSAALGWLDRDSLSELPIDLADPSTLLLGSQNGVVYFAARVLCDDPEALPGGEKSFRSLRSLVAELPEEDAAIAAHAISLCYFHDRHRFCGSCGAATTPEQGGTRLRCRRNLRGESTAVLHGGGRDGHDDGSCSGVWFPRIDCVSIMLVVSSDGNRCLMGRASRFRSKMWSCLAGFLEHGERIEDGARREVLEESGVVVGEKVRYFGSQPWPQPYSLMLGCVVQSDPAGEEITVDKNELEDARWFTRDQVASMVANVREGRPAPNAGDDPSTYWVPPGTSIAGQMLKAFAGGDPITCFTSPRL